MVQLDMEGASLPCDLSPPNIGAAADSYGWEVGSARCWNKGCTTGSHSFSRLEAFRNSQASPSRNVHGHHGSFRHASTWQLSCLRRLANQFLPRYRRASPVILEAGDPDSDFTAHLRPGVPLVVDGQDPDNWPTKLELGSVPTDLQGPSTPLPLTTTQVQRTSRTPSSRPPLMSGSLAWSRAPSPNMKLPGFVDATRKTFVWEPWRASRSRTRSGPFLTPQPFV